MARKLALQHVFCYAPQTVATWCIFEEGLSRTTATNPEQAIRAMAGALAHFAADPGFPGWYPALFDPRWRFPTSRPSLLARPVDHPVLLPLCVHSCLGPGILLSGTG